MNRLASFALTLALAIDARAVGALTLPTKNMSPQSVEERITSLESRFHVKIARVGEQTTDSSATRSYQSKTRVPCRSPEEYELAALETALLHSEPSHLYKGSASSGLKICFLAEHRLWGPCAEWSFDIDGKPAVFIEPGHHSMRELCATLIHELAHNAEHRMGFDPENPMSWKASRMMGWRHSLDFHTGKVTWLLSTGCGLYQRLENRSWVKSDSAGRYLDTEGHRVKLRDADILSDAEVAQIATVRPATSYFDNPWEEFAEAMKLYRLGRDSRRLLQVSSPRLYEVVRSFDEQELSKTYGKNAKLRTADGLIVDYSAEESTKLASFEASDVPPISAAP